MNIGIFEPDFDIGYALGIVLTDLGHIGHAANNYDSAKKVLGACKLDVVILSKHLMEDVRDLAREIKHKGVRVICISTSPIDGTNCDAFIQEPFNIEDLENAINN